MSIDALIAEFRRTYQGFMAPTDSTALDRLTANMGPLPESVLRLYCGGLASAGLPRRGKIWMPVRLMAVDEVIADENMLSSCSEFEGLGHIAWLWSDDNSNFVGVYTDGLLAGWVTKLDHEEPSPIPAYRSVASFMRQLIDSTSSDTQTVYDAPSIPSELPDRAASPDYLESDRRLVQYFQTAAQAATNEDARRLLLQCAITLTPIEDQAQVVAYFREDDMWIPETAVALLAYRGYQGAIKELEWLAREGSTNGDSAAMRQLVRLSASGSLEADEAIRRLQAVLTDLKLTTLNQWQSYRSRLLPPHWP